MTRLFHDFLVRWVQQLHGPSSSLTDVKDSFTQAVCERASYFICHYWQTELFPQLKVYHVHLATLPLSILLEEQAHARVQCLARASVKQFRSLQSRRNGTNAGANQWPLWENRSLHNVHHGQRSDQWRVSPSQWWKLRKLEFGRHLKPCGKKSLGCWCFRVTTHFGWGSALWQEWAHHAALAWFHNRSMTLPRVSDLKLQVFKRHFCYQRVNGSCWTQVVGGCIFVTSSEWWYILNEIKEACRMWAIL